MRASALAMHGEGLARADAAEQHAVTTFAAQWGKLLHAALDILARSLAPHNSGGGSGGGGGSPRPVAALLALSIGSVVASLGHKHPTLQAQMLAAVAWETRFELARALYRARLTAGYSPSVALLLLSPRSPPGLQVRTPHRPNEAQLNERVVLCRRCLILRARRRLRTS
eukprot:SAG11_NODE_27_length_23309_cov_10.579362_19_plen_169_part_00